jgi:hypothetical protein
MPMIERVRFATTLRSLIVENLRSEQWNALNSSQWCCIADPVHHMCHANSGTPSPLHCWCLIVCGGNRRVCGLAGFWKHWKRKFRVAKSCAFELCTILVVRLYCGIYFWIRDSSEWINSDETSSMKKVLNTWSYVSNNPPVVSILQNHFFRNIEYDRQVQAHQHCYRLSLKISTCQRS